MYSYKALKLDASYRPIGIIPSIDALVSSIVGKSIVLETHDRYISSARSRFALPSVIVIDRVARRVKTFPCNMKHVFIRDGGSCQYCGKKLTKSIATLDHVVPKSKGGVVEWDNIVLSCMSCNQKKGSRSLEESGMKLRRKPKVLSYKQYLSSINLDNLTWKDYI